MALGGASIPHTLTYGRKSNLEQTVTTLGLKNKHGGYDNFAQGDVVTVTIGNDSRLWGIEKITFLGFNYEQHENEGRVGFRRKSTVKDRENGAGPFVYMELSFTHLFKYGMRHYDASELPTDNPNTAFMRSKLGKA